MVAVADGWRSDIARCIRLDAFDCASVLAIKSAVRIGLWQMISCCLIDAFAYEILVGFIEEFNTTAWWINQKRLGRDQWRNRSHRKGDAQGVPWHWVLFRAPSVASSLACSWASDFFNGRCWIVQLFQIPWPFACMFNIQYSHHQTGTSTCPPNKWHFSLTQVD